MMLRHHVLLVALVSQAARSEGMQPKWRSSDLTVDNEGFVLAMRFGTNSEFAFDSPYWTNDELVDEANMSATKNADGKFRPFLSTVAGQIKGCFLKQNSTEIQGCVTYTLPRPKTLKDLFKTPQNTLQFELVPGRKRV